VEFRRQLAIVRAWLLLIVVSLLLSGAAAYVISSLQPKVYEAKATLIVGQSLSGVNPDYNQLLVSQRLSTTYATIATTRPILAKVIQTVGLKETPDELTPQLTATAAPDSALLTIAARDGDPERASAIANAVAEELIGASPAVRGQQEDVLDSIGQDLTAIRNDVRATQAQIDDLTSLRSRTSQQETTLQSLQDRVVSLRATYATLLSFSSNNAANLLTVVQPAVPPDVPVAPRPLLSALLAAMVGFLVACGIAFVVEYLDDTIKEPRQVQETIGLPTLGTVKRMKGARDRRPMYRLETLLYPRSLAAEAYRKLRTNLEFAAVDAPIHTLLVTSAAPAEGKTVTAANLAIVFAQAGRRVLLVDADLRQPGLNEIFDRPNAVGLTALLRVDNASYLGIVQTTDQENLDLLTTGPLPPNPAELLGSQRMKNVVDAFRTAYELLIFDSPPLDVVTDAGVLSAFLDGTVLVVAAGRSRREPVRRASEALAKAGAKVLGVVLNGLSKEAYPEYQYYEPDAELTGGAKVESSRTA
jgi:polysaccharide biosynthesis transport protein